MKTRVDFRLIFITDRKLNNSKNILQIVRSAAKAGVKAIMLREKDLNSKELLNLARSLKKITQQYNSNLIISERLDIALLAKADGLNLPDSDLPVKLFRSFNQNIIIGKSVHSKANSMKAEKESADYILFGPIFSTPAKVKYGKPQGLNRLNEVRKLVKIPVFAVGGITPERAGNCIDAGAHGVAVIRAIMQSDNIRRTVNEFNKVIGQHCNSSFSLRKRNNTNEKENW